MSLSVKILEKHAGTLSRTATASLGGLITSEDTGYVESNCTKSLITTDAHYWQLTGTSGTAMALDYNTDEACVSGHIVFFRCEMMTPNANIDQFRLYVKGTTGGTTMVSSNTAPDANEMCTLYGSATLDGTYSGDIILQCYVAEAAGVGSVVVNIYNWTAIDVTDQFGEEVQSTDLEDFYEWRWSDWTYKNKFLYSLSGDGLYYASKIASHGLEYNDVVHFDPASESSVAIDFPWSLVYPLNNDWIITVAYGGNRGDDSISVDYFTKIDRTDKVLARTLNINMREDIDASASMSFRSDSTWQPQLGMTVYVLNGDEYLFCGYISQNKITGINATNWRCDCHLTTILDTSRWDLMPGVPGEADYKSNTGLVCRLHTGYLLGSGKCFWYGNFDDGNSTVRADYSKAYRIYDLWVSIAKSAGLNLICNPERRVSVVLPSRTPASAPRSIIDDPVDAFNLSYSESMDDYGSAIWMDGGYDTDASQAAGHYAGTKTITDDTEAMNAKKYLQITDSTITSDTDATAAAQLYYNAHGKAVPGQFSFTTGDLDYRPGQKISVQVARLGMTATKTMLIDTVTLFDLDGTNIQSNVVCNNRDSTTFSAAPKTGTTAYMTNMSSKISASVSSLTQEADTFEPYFSGSGTAGTWTWTTRAGYYVRHGNMCFISIQLKPATITDSPTGSLKLSGLPFTSATQPDAHYLSVFAQGLNWGTSATQLSCVIARSSTYGYFFGTLNNGSAVGIDVGNVTAGDDIRITGWYKITT